MEISKQRKTLRILKARAVNRRIRLIIKFFNILEKLIVGNLQFNVQKVDLTVDSDFIARLFQGSEELFNNYADQILKSGVTEAQLFEGFGFEQVAGSTAPGNLKDLATIEGLEHIRENLAISKIPLETTKNQFQTVFNDFNKLPEAERTFPELINRVKGRFKEISQRTFSRARTIATTEMNNLANFSNLRGAVHGGATHKRWVWSGVERDFHASMNGQTVPVDGFFTSGLGNSIPFPNGSGIAKEDINCTCDMVYQKRNAVDLMPAVAV